MSSNTQVEYITLYKLIKDVLNSVSHMKENVFVLDIKGDNSKVLCSNFENTQNTQEYNKGVITTKTSL